MWNASQVTINSIVDFEQLNMNWAIYVVQKQLLVGVILNYCYSKFPSIPTKAPIENAIYRSFSSPQ